MAELMLALEGPSLLSPVPQLQGEEELMSKRCVGNTDTPTALCCGDSWHGH